MLNNQVTFYTFVPRDEIQTLSSDGPSILVQPLKWTHQVSCIILHSTWI